MDTFAKFEVADDDEQDDVGYWYGERANISFLAGGAWLAGYAAMEEYRSDKIRSKKKSNGRVDLYICKNNGHAEIEAKYLVVNGSIESHLQQHIERQMKKAVSDALATTGVSFKIACAFYAPYFAKGRKVGDAYETDPEGTLSAHLNRYLKNRDISWAWCFPKYGRRLSSTGDDGKDYYMPGIVLGLKTFER